MNRAAAVARVALGIAALGGVGCGRAAQAEDHAAPAPPAPAAPAPPPEAAPPLTVPSDWAPVPAIADAAAASATQGAGNRAIAVRAWGEPSLGCFATLVELTGVPGEAMATVVLELQRTLDAALDVEQWTYAEGPIGEVTGTIRQGSLGGAVRGRLRAEASGVPHAAVAACFYNERAPARCQLACTALLASLEAPPVKP